MLEGSRVGWVGVHDRLLQDFGVAFTPELGDLLGGLRFAVSRMQERRNHFFRVGSAEAGEFPAELLPSCGLARAVKARSAAVSGIRFTWCLLCQTS